MEPPFRIWYLRILNVSFITNNNPWQFFDIDDSDLPSFVCPSNPNLLSSNSRALIPSPVGVIQAVIMNRPSRESFLTKEFITRVHQETQFIIVKTCTLNGLGDMGVTLKVTNNFGIHKFAFDVHMLLICDTSVAEG
ncbi:hypothetical protein HKD37_07G018014 [Glycine soja]